MSVKRPGCVAYDDPMHYRNGKRYELVGEMKSMEWAKKIAWDKIGWVRSVSGDYFVRTCVMESIRSYMGDANPFPDKEWRQAMLVMIPPQVKLVIHNDANFIANPKTSVPTPPYERFHIPITTNDQCKCYMHIVGTEPEEWEGFHCEVGKIYQMDPTIYHYSENLGTEDRIHLCIDLKVMN